MGMNLPNRSRMTMSEINVTPLVDVMLVLLIMFMVTAPLMQQGIEVEPPKTKSSGVDLNEEPLILVIDSSEKISIAKNHVDMTSLGKKLNAILLGKKNKQVYIQADRRVNYGFVAEVMAEIRSAGIFNIGLITIPKDSN